MEQDLTQREIVAVKYYTLQILEKLQEELFPHDGHKHRPMSEETKHIVEQGNIEEFEFKELTKIRCEICQRYMSVGRTGCYCKGMIPGASEEVEEQIVKHVIQNFDFLTMSAFKIKKGIARGNKHVISKEAQDHDKAKDALKSAPKNGYSDVFARNKDDNTDCRRMTGQGSKMIFADELKKQRSVAFAVRMLLKNKSRKNDSLTKKSMK